MTALASCPGCGRSDLGSNDHVVGGSRASSRVYYRQSCPCGWWGPEAETLDGAREQWNLRAPALRWRRAPPDVPGWYWHRSQKNRSPRMRRYSLSARQWFAAHLSQD